MNFEGIFRVMLLAVLPVSEIRGALPYGVFAERLPLPVTFGVAFLGNVLPFFLVMYLIPCVFSLFQRMQWFRRFWSWYTERAKNRFVPYRRYGKWGIFFFIGIPLPFTGVWTGSLVAFLAGFRTWEIFPFVLGGIALAGSIVTLFVLFGRGI
ncbi:MAG: small multi-drug export protein [Atribacterota bacterium]